MARASLVSEPVQGQTLCQPAPETASNSVTSGPAWAKRTRTVRSVGSVWCVTDGGLPDGRRLSRQEHDSLMDSFAAWARVIPHEGEPAGSSDIHRLPPPRRRTSSRPAGRPARQHDTYQHVNGSHSASSKAPASAWPQGHRDLLVGELARLHPPVLPCPVSRGWWDRSLAQTKGPGGLISGEDCPHPDEIGQHSQRL
jgi:hypothetical protein